MAAPPIVERHKHHFHRQAPIKEPVRAATTANITIATALNNGDSLDGVTLATGDRVLVKDQSSGAENGIYVVGASPARDYDVSTDDPAFGYLVLVREGTANAGKVFRNSNTTAPTIGTTALTFAEFGAGGGVTVQEEGSPLATLGTTLNFTGSGVTATGAGATKTIDIPGAAPAAFAGAHVYASAALNLSTATETLLLFNSERFDTDAYHSLVTNTGRLTVPAGKAGKYIVGAQVRLTTSPGDPSYIVIKQTFAAGGSANVGIGNIPNSGSIPLGNVASLVDAAVGDYFEIYVFALTASKQALSTGNYTPEAWIALIGS